MLRRIALCLCFLTLLLPLLSCQPGAPGPVALQTDIQAQAPSSERREIELVLWTHEFPTYTEGLRTKWIPEFEALHPGVTIKYEIFPYSGSIVSFDSKLLADVFSGSGPDVWAMASHNFTQAEYIEAGMLAPLDLSLFGYDSIADLEQDYPKNSLSIFIQDGKVYGLLNELTTLCLYYNKTMFDAAGIVYPLAQNPSSWQTLGESSQQLLKIDLTSGVPEQMGYQFGFFANYPAAEWYIQDFYPIMRQYGQADLYVNGEPAGDSAAVVAALQQFYDFTHVYRAYDPYFSKDWFSPFANGQIAMLTAGSWFTSAILDINPDVQFGVAPHPVVDPEDPTSFENIMYSFGWVVNANSDMEHQRLAQEFLAFILGKKGEWEQPLWWLENVGLLQPRLALLQSPGYRELLAKDPWMQCFTDTFDAYRVDYYQHSSDEAGAALVRAINRVVYDKMAPAESARLLQNELLLLP